MGSSQVWVVLAIAALAGAFSAHVVVSAEEIPHGVADKPWPVALGNHRVRVKVAAKADAVRVHIPWRRRDASPENKAIVIYDAATGEQIRNVVAINVTRESGDVAFQPATTPGEYYVYYMPFTERRIPHQFATNYIKPQEQADAAWVKRHGLTRERLADGRWESLPKANVLRIEARSEFHRFDPMEVVATADETRRLIDGHPGQAYLLFPEDRRHAIRMFDALPLRWIRRGPTTGFRGQACRAEFYVFQIGLFAARQTIEDVTVECGALRSTQGKEIPAGAVRCFNLGGLDWLGREFKKRVRIERGKVQALWFGVQVPANAPAGDYCGTLTMHPAGARPTVVELTLAVSADAVEDAGDNELWRLARLRWLDSTIGVDDEPSAPYGPLVVNGCTVTCLGRSIQFGETGLPDRIRSRFTKTGRIRQDEGAGREILAGPIAMVVDTAGGVATWTGQPARIVRTAPGAVHIESHRVAGPVKLDCQAKMEFDGYVNYRITVSAERDVNVSDIRLEIPLRRDVATYMMGLGRKGGYRPGTWEYKWDPSRANSALWLGDVDAGLHCRLKDPEDGWYLYGYGAKGPPDAWHNGGKGGCTVSERGDDCVAFTASSGQRTLRAGEKLQFCFGLLITPVKPLDPSHWNERYYHAYVPVEKAAEVGANIINIHHGNELNPNINYPFRAGPTKKLTAYVKRAHEKGVKVKVYYTVRELSNYVAELWPLRSLNHEVFVDGNGGGHSWLQEHLITGYGPAWHHILPNGDVDAAIAQVGLSRWHNYYLEGLSWLTRNVGIDGLYLDGIGYNREIMKRVRRVMDRAKPGCLIDFHSGNNFHPNYGLNNCANQYMEHFPYINSIWFGEGYDYNETPDYWLVEVSGLPFGLFGEMLQGGGNPWRGMVYGMTGRYYQGADPGRIWKIWDAFGIAEAEMIGYWAPSCPVKTSHRDVLATAYVKKGKVLIALASWAKEQVACRLTIDWQAVGLNATKANLYAPPIRAFQPAALFAPSEAIPVIPGRGWLLILDEAKHDLPQTKDETKGRAVLFCADFTGDRLGPGWRVHTSKQPDTRVTVKNGSLLIEAKANCCAYVERTLPAGVELVECRVQTGTDRGATWGPGLCLVWPGGKILRINVRAEGRFGVDDGKGQ